MIASGSWFTSAYLFMKESSNYNNLSSITMLFSEGAHKTPHLHRR